jgi:hypothetical protein
MGKCQERYPCLEQVQHSFTEYKSYMYMFKLLTVNLILQPPKRKLKIEQYEPH